MSNNAPAIIAAVAILLFAAGSAQGPAAAPAPHMAQAPSSPGSVASAPGPAGVDCMTSLYNLSDCLSYVMENSTVTVPDPNCCPELAGLVESSPQCLCLLLGNVSASGFSIDLHRALRLPSVCRVTTPDPSLCSDFGYPVPGVGSAPASAPTPTGGMAPGESGGTPTPGSNGSGDSGIATHYAKPALFSALIFALLSTFF